MPVTLQIGRAIGRGIRRAANRTGVVLAILTFVYLVSFTAAVNTLFTAALPASAASRSGIGLTLPVPPPVAGLILVVGMLFGMVVYLAATRAFTREEDSWNTVTTDLFTRRIGRAVVSAVGANLVVSIAVMVGFVLLVIPGLFLSVSFVFVVFVIGVEDASAIDALRRSWGIASDHRWRLLVLVIVVGVGTGAVASIGSLLSVVNPALGQLLSLLVTAPLSVLSYGVLADAYFQLREG